jgi:uncharacterized protein (DUF433 family)
LRWCVRHGHEKINAARIAESFPVWYVLVREFRRLSMALEHFDRITQDPDVMGGKPCIRGMRLTVGRILSQIGAGETIEELLVDYPYLEREDILQSLQYAAWLAQGRELTIA